MDVDRHVDGLELLLDNLSGLLHVGTVGVEVELDGLPRKTGALGELLGLVHVLFIRFDGIAVVERAVGKDGVGHHGEVLAVNRVDDLLNVERGKDGRHGVLIAPGLAVLVPGKVVDAVLGDGGKRHIAAVALLLGHRLGGNGQQVDFAVFEGDLLSASIADHLEGERLDARGALVVILEGLENE